MKRFCLLLLMMTLLTACTAQAVEYDLTFTDRELSGEWKEKNAVTLTGRGDTCEISGKGAKMDGSTLTITAEGVYILTGSFSGNILIDAGDEDKVQLVLSGATVTSPDGPAIRAENADKVFITAAPDTLNTLSDAEIYEGDDSADAVIFSRADLCLNGAGSLNVQGFYKHGVVSKDDLIIANTTLTVEAASTALEGKDCLMVTGSTVTLTAGSNGLRSDNDEDEGRGFIYVKDSTLTVTAGTDGLQAETLLRADDAVMTIMTGGGSANAQASSSGDDWGSSGGRSSASDESTGSWKALKAKHGIEINGGSYTIDSADDCIHSNHDLTITGGTFTLTSGDDGIHADNELLISGGDFVITKSYEGIEASKLTIAGGTIDITASDDGLNAAGGADGSASADRWGRGMFSNGVGEIIISGGYIHISANGDGIDSNNTILVSGGVTLVSGSRNSMNAAFDYDGEATVTGGVLIAVGGSGMAQSFTAAENQGCMLFKLTGGTAGHNMAIVNEEGRVVASYTPVNGYSAVVATAPGIQVGSTYTVVMDAVIDGADANGFAMDAAYTDGSALGSLEMTTALQGGSGHSMGGGRGR